MNIFLNFSDGPRVFEGFREGFSCEFSTSRFSEAETGSTDAQYRTPFFTHSSPAILTVFSVLPYHFAT